MLSDYFWNVEVRDAVEGFAAEREQMGVSLCSSAVQAHRVQCELG